MHANKALNIPFVSSNDENFIANKDNLRFHYKFSIKLITRCAIQDIKRNLCLHKTNSFKHELEFKCLILKFE